MDVVGGLSFFLEKIDLVGKLKKNLCVWFLVYKLFNLFKIWFYI